MGLMSRRKGRAFEQRIARIFRERWPDAVVRRSSQAERAHESDVFIAGGPRVLSKLWLECQDARNPTPIAKLEQAEHDSEHVDDCEPRFLDRTPVPVVIWHRLGAREINVTLREWAYDYVRGIVPGLRFNTAALTLSLDDFLDVLTETPREEAA